MSELRSIDDFKPLFKYLLNRYDYLWVYAASAAGYNPYDGEVTPPYNRILSEALIEASP
jgi:hypothetical protein